MDENINEELRFINMKLDGFSDKMDESSDKISKIKDALYHPDNGIYARIRSNEHVTEDIVKWTKEHEERDASLHATCEKIATSVVPIADDYKIRMSRKIWTDKIVGIIITFIIGATLTLTWKVVTMSSKVDKAEEQKNNN